MNKNPLDLFVVTTLIIFALLIFWPLKEQDSGQMIMLSIKIKGQSLKEEAEKQKKVYLNSQEDSLPVVSVKSIVDQNNEADLQITVQGNGKIEDNRYIFNGQRVLVGQKAEIHSTYWAQGIITEIKYAD